MAQGSNEQTLKAKALFEQGMSLVDIARELGVSDGTVRSWKSRNGLGSDKPATLQKKKTQRCKQKRSVANTDKRTVDAVLENSELNSEQQLFCVLYAKTLNATQSYKKAYGCSYETAMVNGGRLLRKTKVKEEINRLKKERFENQLFDEHDIFQFYLDIATACITDYVTFGREEVPVMNMFGPVMVDKPDGNPGSGGKIPLMKEVNYVKFQESLEIDGRAIKKVKMGKDGASIELYDSMKAMEWLAEHMSMGTSGQQGLAQNIMSAYEKRKADKEKEGTPDAE